MTITGQFIDNDTLEAIPGVSVILTTAAGTQIKGTAADSMGKFTITDDTIYPGTDTLLSISDIDYEPAIVNSEVLFTNPVIKLTPEYDDLQAVVVTPNSNNKSSIWPWIIGGGLLLLLLGNKNSR